ncbi:hypothetical protein PSUB009319_02310 [Ralstonia sp. SET104]|nr:hypothetical protein PSUB009319_02310 [Ralstonia sp. SET104]
MGHREGPQFVKYILCAQPPRAIWRPKMIKHALFARLIAKPGKEQAVADFLAAGLQMANPFV